MPTLYLVRHGQAAAAWHKARDPGLDATGRAQAERLADELAAAFSVPARLLTSPLLRARETAAPLARRWGIDAVPEPGVAEVPSPGLDLAERGEWLQRLLGSRWTDVDDGVRAWRDQAVETLLGCREDAVIVTHAVLINAVVAAVTGDERVLVFRPDYCSVSVIEHDGGDLRVERLGGDAETRVL